MSSSAPKYNYLPLDLPLEFQEDELRFFKATTGITDTDALIEHIKKVQVEAYHTTYPYPCIRRFNFCRFKVLRSPAWPAVKERGIREDDALFVDLGCCFGTDVRSVVADGYPANYVLGVDLEPAFITQGHALFLSTPSTAPPFLTGDIFSPTFFFPSESPSPLPLPPLDSLTTLAPLAHRVRHLHSSSVFHLFSRPTQSLLAHRLAALMLPPPGSTIFGSHAGLPVAGSRPRDAYRKGKEGEEGTWCHSPESWRALWEEVFGGEKGKVKVEAELVDRRKARGKEMSRVEDEKGQSPGEWLLVWSVVLL